MNDPIRPDKWQHAIRDFEDRKKGRTPEAKKALLDKAQAIRTREADRVAAIILRDQTERDRDLRRIEARVEIAQGKFVNLDESKDTLPHEQLEAWQSKDPEHANDFEHVTVRLPEETIREYQTIRRVDRVGKLFKTRKIDIEEFACCLWYRNQWERSGLDPLIASNFDPKFGSGPRDFGHLARTAAQAEARDEYRWARSYIPDDVVGLFDQVVLNDHSVREASRLSRCRFANGPAAFRRGLLGLIVYVAPIVRADSKLLP